MDLRDNSVCPMCESPFLVEEQYPYQFCPSCREQALNRPISKKVTFFVIGIVIFALLMLFRLPASINAAVQYERGMNSAENHYFSDATQHYESVLKANPDATKVLVDYYEVQVDSMQLTESQKTLDQLIALDDSPEESIANRVNAATNKAETYYYQSEALLEEVNKNANLSPADQILKLTAFLKTNPSLSGTALLSEYLYAQGDYKAVVAVLEPEIKAYPDWLIGYNNLIPALRNLGEYDQAKAYSLQFIEQWKDNTTAYIIAAKVDIAREDYKSALDIALKAPYSKLDYYLNGTLAIIYSQLGDTEKQQLYFGAFNAAENTDQSFIDYVNEHIKKSN